MNYDYIVTNNEIKKSILMKVDDIIGPKIISKQDLVSLLFGEVSNDSLIYLMDNHNLNIYEAKEIIKNIMHLDDFYDDLKKNNLISDSFNLKNKSFLTINEHLDEFILKKLNKSKVENFELDKLCFPSVVYKFKNIYEEVYFVASQISELLKTVDINHIKIVNLTDNYLETVDRVFSLFNIPVNLKRSQKLYKTKCVSCFIEELRLSKNITQSLNKIKNTSIKEKVINILNKYETKIIGENLIDIIDEDLQLLTESDVKYKNAVDTINVNEIYDKDNYYFIVNFNEGAVPNEFKDEDYLSDEIKIKRGILTSIEKNKFNKNLVINILKSFPNLYITYKEQDLTDQALPSYLVNELNLVVKEHEKKYVYSDDINKLELSKSLDNFIKYNEKNSNLNLLLSNYNNVDYSNFNNSYTKINKINNNKKLTLSYTSLDDYYKCSFKYYIKKVLKIDPFEETIHLIIGNYFHYILERMYNLDFNLEQLHDEFISEYKLTNKYKFYLNKLKNEVSFVVDTIKKMEENSSLNEVKKELKIHVKKEFYNVYGVIDKILYKDVEGKRVAIIIDYKTGNISNNLDNINHGFNLQLPIYAYLISEEYENLILGGVYLQKVLHDEKTNEDASDKEKKLKLLGYTIKDLSLLDKIDSNYSDESFINSIKLTKENEFYKTAKVLDRSEFDKIIEVANLKLEEAAEKINNMEFDINPKKMKSKKVGCNYCDFKDVCFVKEENYLELEETPFKEVLENELDR